MIINGQVKSNQLELFTFLTIYGSQSTIFDSGSSNSCSIHQIYDSTQDSTRLRTRPCDICLIDECRVRTPIRQNLIHTFLQIQTVLDLFPCLSKARYLKEIGCRQLTSVIDVFLFFCLFVYFCWPCCKKYFIRSQTKSLVVE